MKGRNILYQRIKIEVRFKLINEPDLEKKKERKKKVILKKIK